MADARLDVLITEMQAIAAVDQSDLAQVEAALLSGVLPGHLAILAVVRALQRIEAKLK